MKARRALLFVSLLGACNTLTYYQAPQASPTSRVTFTNPGFANVTMVHYANNSNCTGFEQVRTKPMAAGEEQAVDLEAGRDHSFGLNFIFSGDFEAVTLYALGAMSKFRACSVYVTFPVEPASTYRAVPKVDADHCWLELERMSALNGEWEPAPIRVRLHSDLSREPCVPE